MFGDTADDIAEPSGEEATFPHEEVASWLETWGTPDYKPFLKPKSA